MIEHKHLTKILIALTAVTVLICFTAVIFHAELGKIMGGSKIDLEYEDELFDTSKIIDINIIMDQKEWDSMLERDNALSEEYHSCDVIVNGKKFKNVGIRPKGNSSLSYIAYSKDSVRYSFKLEFDHFEQGQTCFGLDKLILNNNYADATYMKEAVIYDLFQYLDADASLYNYSKLSLNGNYWGLYLALEAVEDSFLLRNYGTQNGELYKPDITGEDLSENASAAEIAEFFNDNGGCDLNYKDDKFYSYRNIWKCEITNTGRNDHMRVIRALKNIGEGNDLERYMDVDNILKYMAVHEFAVNRDSLSGPDMPHNYYLYEYKGKLNIFPWDYNLSFGGYGGAGPIRSINDAIDTPFEGTHFFDKLLENKEYYDRYHEYLEKTVEYTESGRFDETYNRIRSQIDDLVDTDPNSFYDHDRYDLAATSLYKTVMFRSESIDHQLKGLIPSTESGQAHDPNSRIDTSEIDFAVMGSMEDIGFDFAPEEEEAPPEKGLNKVLNDIQENQPQQLVKYHYDVRNALNFVVCLLIMIIAFVVLAFIKPKRFRKGR